MLEMRKKKVTIIVGNLYNHHAATEVFTFYQFPLRVNSFFSTLNF
jgi:hypothetical protein